MNRDFHLRVSGWLKPRGYTEVYRSHHLLNNDDEVHFMIDEVRLICKKIDTQEFCYFHADCKTSPMTAIISEKFPIGFDELDEKCGYMIESKHRHESKRSTKSIIIKFIMIEFLAGGLLCLIILCITICIMYITSQYLKV